jgi:hypothetical protein
VGGGAFPPGTSPLLPLTGPPAVSYNYLFTLFYFILFYMPAPSPSTRCYHSTDPDSWIAPTPPVWKAHNTHSDNVCSASDAQQTPPVNPSHLYDLVLYYACSFLIDVRPCSLPNLQSSLSIPEAQPEACLRFACCTTAHIDANHMHFGLRILPPAKIGSSAVVAESDSRCSGEEATENFRLSALGLCPCLSSHD